MTRKIQWTLFVVIASICLSFGQGKMIYGQKHLILLSDPANWIQVQNEQLPYLIKPDEKNVSDRTYMYVFGIDYPTSPDLNGWIEGNTNYLKTVAKGVVVSDLPITFEDKKQDYLTGRSKTITYEYEDGRKEALLIIECKNTIVTVVLSVDKTILFDQYLPAFKALIATLKISNATVKTDK